MGSLRKNIHLMLEFLKASLLVRHFSNYASMTFLMMLHVEYCYLCWWCYTLRKVWSCIWSMAATRIGFWTRIWSTRHCQLGQEVACWFQYCKNSTVFCFFFLHWSCNTGAIDVEMMVLYYRQNFNFLL